LVLRAYAYPSLLARLSPGAAFEAYAAAHAPGEPLGILGIDRHALFTTDLVTLPSAEPAASWLLAPSRGRRFLALDARELTKVNAAYRAARHANVPIVAGDGGSVLLAASSLARGEKSESLLDRVVLDAPPQGLRALDAQLGAAEGSAGDRLEVVGWEITNGLGE